MDGINGLPKDAVAGARPAGYEPVPDPNKQAEKTPPQPEKAPPSPKDNAQISSEAKKEAAAKKEKDSPISGILNAISDTKEAASGRKAEGKEEAAGGLPGQKKDEKDAKDTGTRVIDPNSSGNDGAKGKKANPDDTLIRYVCSKGDVEYHKPKDSRAAVQAHEERHIAEYNDFAAKHGVKVASPEITVNTKFMPDLETDVSTGGLAKCHFVADLDGKTVNVPMSNDGNIADQDLAKKLKSRGEKKEATGLGGPPLG
jgi:hypothetical protein